MAYLAAKKSALTSDPQGSPLSSEAGPAPVATTAGLSTSPGQPAGGAGGGMQDFRDYLSANEGSSKALLDRLVGDPNAGTGGLSGEAASAAPQAMLLGSQYAQAGSPAEQGYKGEVAARNATAQAAKAKVDSYGGEGGLETLLSDTVGKGGASYTPGMANLDAYLLGGAGGNERLDALKAKWGPLLGAQADFSGSATPQAGFKGVPVSEATPTAAPTAAPAPAPQQHGRDYPDVSNPGASPGGRQDAGEWTWNPQTNEWERSGANR
jgi:hypothetical protein